MRMLKDRSVHIYFYAGKLDRWRPHVVLRLLAWAAARTPPLYCMLYMHVQGFYILSNKIPPRNLFPRAASCDLQEQGTSPVCADSLEWDCRWLRTMYLFSRCRYLSHCVGPDGSEKLIAGNSEARRHSSWAGLTLQMAMCPSGKGIWPNCYAGC